jgi:hypothetical protein
MAAYTPRSSDSPSQTRKRIASALAAIAGAENNFSIASPAYAANAQDQDQSTQRRIAEALAAIADARAARNSLVFTAAGDASIRSLVMGIVTTSATAADLSLTGATAATGNRLLVATNAILSARVTLNAATSHGAIVAHFVRDVVIRNNAGTVSLVGSVATLGTDIADAGASGWGGVAITADNTNKAIKIAVTGAASTTIHWIARIDTVETTF